ncbi:unnamed protein product [Dibothriocephalus latus]|uniref:Uncharacterized protein n=1 Tax=Dibothriocephalus latus TaxID=60516 RepID=A0A3P7M100_DIBLA|nr:unnamed protein product [Dibothriocephalus latus]
MWARRIQAERFKWYNSQWLEMIEVTDQHSARTPLGLRDSGQEFRHAYYDSEEEDSENLVMAATLLEDAAGWFPSTGNKPSLGGDKGALEPPLDYFGNLGIFYPGTEKDIGANSNTATQMLRHSQGDQPDIEPSFLSGIFLFQELLIGLFGLPPDLEFDSLPEYLGPAVWLSYETRVLYPPCPAFCY